MRPSIAESSSPLTPARCGPGQALPGPSFVASQHLVCAGTRGDEDMARTFILHMMWRSSVSRPRNLVRDATDQVSHLSLDLATWCGTQRTMHGVARGAHLSLDLATWCGTQRTRGRRLRLVQHAGHRAGRLDAVRRGPGGDRGRPALVAAVRVRAGQHVSAQRAAEGGVRRAGISCPSRLGRRRASADLRAVRVAVKGRAARARFACQMVGRDGQTFCEGRQLQLVGLRIVFR